MSAFVQSLGRVGCITVFAACAAAQASPVSFYGVVDTYLGYSTPATDGDQDATLGIQSNGMTTSFIGASANYEVAGGLKAIGAVEMFFRPDTAEQGRFGNDVFFARSAYVGLQGDFGTLKIGRNANPYFISAISLNPFGDSFGFSPMVLMSFGGGGIVGDSGWSNSIVYSSPKINGVNGNVAYAFGEAPGDTGINKMGANIFYSTGSFGMSAAAHKVSGPQAGAGSLAEDDSQTAAILGLSYDFSMVKLFGQYQMIRDDRATGDIDRDTLVISAAIPAGPGQVWLSYGSTDTSTDAGSFDRDILTLVYHWSMTAKFDVYGAFVNNDVETLEKTGRTLALGARLRF